MANIQNNEVINAFFQVFVESINDTLIKTLDTEKYQNIQFIMDSFSKTYDIDNIKENMAIYKSDYTVGPNQGTLMVFLPLDLITDISDTTVESSGKDSPQGKLSQNETDKTLKILGKIFKDIEADFKKQYRQDLAFSISSSLLVQGMPAYITAFDNLKTDFLINHTLIFDNNKKYNISCLLNYNIIEGLIEDLGFAKAGSHSKKTDIKSLELSNLVDVKINITAELGRTKVPIKHALELVRGSLVELDTLNNSDIKVFANGVEFAYAQVVAVEDNFGLKITKIIAPEEKSE